jgi:spore maturation protein CgeB
MRILITYGRRPPYPPFGAPMVEAFNALGHRAALLCVRDRPWWGAASKRLPEPWKSRWRWDPVASANDQLRHAARAFRPDALLEIGGDLFHAETLRLVRAQGTLLAVWLTQGPFASLPPAVLAEYDLQGSNSQVAVEQLRRAGMSRAAYVPFATDPSWFRPSAAERPPTRPYVGFIGAYSPKRAAMLDAVNDLGLEIWGPDWDSRAASPALRAALRGPQGIFGSSLVRCYQQLPVFINIQREHTMVAANGGHAAGSGLAWRHFDVPACGSALVSEAVIELEDAFRIGREVEAFTTTEELRDKVQYLQTHAPQRLAMIRRARQRVLDEHTYTHRARWWIERFAAGR